MNNLERRHLLIFCKKHGLDTQEIDSEISYFENKKHLTSMIQLTVEENMAAWKTQMEDYYANHRLSDYVAFMKGIIPPRQRIIVAKPVNKFSLKQFVQTQMLKTENAQIQITQR